jgi:eukaryotic-like serine/threonine-protein kinase
VYLGEHPVIGRKVAIKVLHTALAADKDIVARFFNEARAIHLIGHPNIVEILDFGHTPDNQPYFIMEFLTGEALSEIVARGPITAPEVAHIAEQMCRALGAAHAKGIVHRDLKPHNVQIIEKDGSPFVKILDFGVAKILAAPDGSQSVKTRTGSLMGTPLYMSPEQALAHPVDARSDIFSLGAVLYEMLAGRSAFGGETVTKILFQVVSREPDPIATLAPGLPPGIDYVLARCLAKDVNARYRDARTLALDLEDVLAGRPARGQSGWSRPMAGGTMIAPAPAQAPVAAPLPPAAKPSQVASSPHVAKANAVALWAGIAVLGVLGALGGAFYSYTHQPVARRITPPSTEEATTTTTPAEPAPPKTTEPESTQPSGSGPARLSIDLDHSLKAGLLRVFVDDEKVVEEEFGGKVKKDFAGLKLRGGHVTDTLEIKPGRREIRVQVTWEDNDRRETIRGDFKKGGSYRLKAKLGSFGGIVKDLSLDWY